MRFIRRGDIRVKRVRKEGVGYFYYLTKYEHEINLDNFLSETLTTVSTKLPSQKDFKERDLHKLFCTYLNSTNIYSKTIFHEKSTRDDEMQKWTHPDIIGVQLISLQNHTSKSFLKTINKKESFKLMSYELKKEIRNDYELKKAALPTIWWKGKGLNFPDETGSQF